MKPRLAILSMILAFLSGCYVGGWVVKHQQPQSAPVPVNHAPTDADLEAAGFLRA
jgi:hypothetical protein